MLFSRVTYCAALLVLFVLPGCAVVKQETKIRLERPLEITRTPFYPQKRYQCGPASLAMLLGESGVPVQPDVLASRIYLPGRKGSLQPELIAAVRQYGRIPYVINGDLPSLIDEIKGGRPVLVLQNLGIELMPVYHYAVVIGALPDNIIVLRSGTDERLLMGVDDFLETWTRAGSWGFILLKPGEIPADPNPVRYLKAVNSFEIVGNEKAATEAYITAVSHWPKNQNALMALGNNYLRQGNYNESEKILRELLALNPNHIVALNNLAEALVGQECYIQAHQLIDKAVRLAESNGSLYREAVLQTRKEIIQLMMQRGGNEKLVPACLNIPDE